MPWVRLDDRFPSHRKVALLSDRAFRLHVSALCWASENLTEGKILDAELRVIAHVRGAKAAAKELEDRKLWDRIDDGWVIHDFLIYNPDRAQVHAERDANAARQQAWRDRKKAEKEAKAAAARAAQEAERNAVTPPVTNGVSNGTPNPSRPVVPPLEEQQREETASYEEPARIGDRPRIPEASQPLVDAITAAGMSVGWDLKPPEWFLIEALIKRCAIPALVVSAKGSWQGATRQPRSGRYFIPGWRSLADAPSDAGTAHLPVAVGEVTHLTAGHRPATSDARFQQAVETGRRLQAIADAKRNQQEQS
jgi:hypothetical protein